MSYNPKTQQDLFYSAFNYSSIGMAIVGTDGSWIDVNDSLLKFIGYSREELLAGTFQDITHPEDLDADLAQMHQLLDGKIDSYEMEKRYFHKNGQIIRVLLTVSMGRTEEGELFFISQIQDITNRKRTEEKLKASEAELALLVNETDTIFARLDTDCRHLYVNSVVERVTGIKAEDFKGKTFAEANFIDPITQYVEANVKTVIAAGLPIEREVEVERDGKRFVYLLRTIPQFDAKGAIESVSVISTDVTKLKETEKKLRAANEEIKRLKDVIPICSYCKEMRDDEDDWLTAENYITRHTDAHFSHGICPDCYEQFVKPQLESFKNKDSKSD